MPSGNSCNVQFCSWSGQPSIGECAATC
jgi:hypothetical protein